MESCKIVSISSTPNPSHSKKNSPNNMLETCQLVKKNNDFESLVGAEQVNILNYSERESFVQQETISQSDTSQLKNSTEPVESNEQNSSANNKGNDSTKKAKKKYNLTSDEDRETIIKHYLKKIKMSTIARMMGLHVKTVHTIISTYQKTGRIASQVRGGPHKTKLSPEQKEVLKSWVLENCTLSLSKIKGRVQAELDVNVSTTTILRTIETFRFSFDNLKEVSRQGTEIFNQRVANLPRLH